MDLDAEAIGHLTAIYVGESNENPKYLLIY
jgi:hypothetical protein